jgi:transmembrane sensor
VTPARDQVRIAAAGQAAEWFVANQDPARDFAQRAAFVAWLRSSPIHIEEYLGIASVARDLRLVTDTDESVEALVEMGRADLAGPVAPVQMRQSREPPKPYRASPRGWSLAAAVMAAAVCVASWMASEIHGSRAQWYRTGQGEQSVQRLADGSLLHLNSATAVEVEFDGGNRSLRLESGQAFFAVAHGDKRLFRVMAGSAEIVAVGTQFDVRLAGSSTVVTVVEGKVDVRSQDAAAARPARVSAGYRLRIDDGLMPAQSEPVDTGAAIAWLQQRIAFEGRPLGDVADEFNRHGVVQIVIDDMGLRALPISGVFNAYDTNSFAAFLESLDGVRVERFPGKIRVLRRDAAQSRGSPPGH